MPWKCPACETAIQHHDPEPRPGMVYRCNICRLELVVDARTGNLTLAPLPTDTPVRNRRPSLNATKRHRDI
jgi:hypothetical protein